MANDKYSFSWTCHNQFDLLVDGEQYFPAILNDLANARTCIFFEMYLVESGHVLDLFIDALRSAAQRRVRICMLMDDFGIRGTNQHDLQRLTDAGIQLIRYNPVKLGKLRRSLFRNHRKVIIIDGQTTYVGGAGITDAFWAHTRPHTQWHDVMLRIEGESSQHWQQLFLSTWQRLSKSPALSAPIANKPKGDQRGRVVINSHPSHLEIKQSFLSHVRRARQRLWMATAYFVPSWKLRRFLCRAANRGIDVRLLVPGPHTDHPAIRHAGRRYYSRLLHHGVRIFEYQPRFIHAKALLIDDWVSIGSSNVDRWGQRWNLDANQEVLDEELAGQVAEFFRHDFSQSREIHLAEWQQRSWYHRLQEWFWGKIDIWMEKWRQYK